MVLPAGCKLEYGGDPVVPYVRIQTKFWDEAKLGPLPPFEHGRSIPSNNPFWPVTSGILQNMIYPPLRSRKGESIQVLLKRLGEPLIAGIEEPDLEGHFKTGMGMLSLTLYNPFSSWSSSY
jgi:hypothetical protein